MGKPRTLKSLGIKRTTMMKHNAKIIVYSFKGKFYTSKNKALKAYEDWKEQMIRSMP